MSKKDKTKLDHPEAGMDDPTPPFGLKILVFTGGAVLMGLEIVGSRVLAPHFGNSVFVWGSLISVFLIALSAGYYVGGRVADRRPSFALLNTLCLVAGLLILLVPYVGRGLCESLYKAGWGEKAGPLLATALLFLPASVLMGMLSPFSVRLAASALHTVGSAAGTLYALSTVGSIAGTLVTTFVLIPQFGVTGILRGLGAVMIAVPFVMLLSRPKRAVAIAPMFFLGVLGAVAPAPASVTLNPGEEIVVDEDTPYHHILVIDSQRGKARVDEDVPGAYRYLRFDRYIESLIELGKPYRSRAQYTDYFHLAFLAKPKISRAVFIGAGGGIGPRTFAEVDPEMRIDVVDIDPRILEVAHDLFKMPVNERVRTHAIDGRMFMRNAAEKYDCVVLDAFTIGGRIPFHLTTREFFELCASRMTDDGVFVMNVNSAMEGEFGGIFLHVAKTLTEVFPRVDVFAKELSSEKPPDRGDHRNQIVIARKGGAEMKREEWEKRIWDYREGSYVTKAMLYPMVKDLDQEWRDDIGPFPTLTDDFAPIETLKF
ncbi:MAG: fused MFS/spermidine synthase [Planctomycetota bacterium]